MATPALSARLRYLNDSAHLLATSTPSTSAYLMSRCNSLMFDNSLDQSDAQKRHVCGACGNIMILGWTGKRQIEAMKPRMRGRNCGSSGQHSSGANSKVVIYTCEKCGRRTRQSINAIIPRSSTAQDTTNFFKAPPLYSSPNIPPLERRSITQISSSALANASSKKRAKIRKQGLQALLAKSRDSDAHASSGFGLDLMDLMKKA